ncbi:Lrp/AsnC family transcriptional regulator [Streptomyces sp. NPDC057575]|uniref:Lrp/AsnC family transcriptional regulator n=1 Tax=unclassified Streptomyces TaxID=2593676 RepID=UPI00367CA1BE
MTQQESPLDDTDRRIIAILQAEGRRPYSQIAEDLGIPASSVRYRVQRLEENGILQVVGIANPLTIGFDRFAMIGLKVRPGTAREVCRQLGDLPETSYVIMTTGQYDIMAEVICRDTQHFTDLVNERLHQIDGVTATESFFVLEVHKLAYGWGVGEVESRASESASPASPAAIDQRPEAPQSLSATGRRRPTAPHR